MMSENRLLLIVEDDTAFARTLARSFERRGYSVIHAANLEDTADLLSKHSPRYAVVDLKLNGAASGLACVQMLNKHDPTVAGVSEPELTNRSTSIKTLEWERIHEVLVEVDFNISEAARRLGMHRRTLARKLNKQQVK